MAEKKGVRGGKRTGAARHVENMMCRLEAQFGHAASCFGDVSRVTGTYPRLTIRDPAGTGNGQLGMLTPERGLISLTLAGAERLASSNRCRVDIDDFIPRGNIFAVGVLSATDDIRAGDEVVVVHDGDVRACGVAMMHGPGMTGARRGMAVSVRHRSVKKEAER